MLRFTSACFALLALTSLGVVGIAGCQPSSQTTRAQGVIDASGFALVHASAPGDNQHWSVDVAMRSSAVGTYALIFSKTEPSDRGDVRLTTSDDAFKCALAHGKSCSLKRNRNGDERTVVATTKVGVGGGGGVLRATFDVGSGGWFSIVRVSDGSNNNAAAAALATTTASTFDVQVISEALIKGEAPHRFTIDVVG